VLCTQTDTQGAAITAKGLIQALAEKPFTTAGKVTASVGVAQWQAGETAEQLMKRADLALYEAKNGGRNRVVVSGSSAPKS
jgi:diguanylate cyclase (GGDEF)-like protein